MGLGTHVHELVQRHKGGLVTSGRGPRRLCWLSPSIQWAEEPVSRVNSAKRDSRERGNLDSEKAMHSGNLRVTDAFHRPGRLLSAGSCRSNYQGVLLRAAS